MEFLLKEIKSLPDSWPKKSGLFLGWTLLVFAGCLAFKEIRDWRVFAFFLTVALLATLVWLSQRKLSKCPENKFGFVVAISVEDQETNKKFERDFCQRLETLLRSGRVSDSIWVYFVPQYHLPKEINEEGARKLRLDTKSGFVLYGQVRTREEDSKKHYIDLHGLVGHAPTDQNNSNLLAKEFTELLPRRIIAPCDNELPAFELSSTFTTMVAKYIAGIGAFLSGAFDYASDMYADAETIAKQLANDHAIAKTILERIPIRNTEIAVYKATRIYNLWRESRKAEDLKRMGEILATAPLEGQSHPVLKTLAAIYWVSSNNGDFESIEKEILGMNQKDPVIQMNLAFFDVRRGDFKSASRHYCAAINLEVTLETASEVIDFLEWYKEENQAIANNFNFALGYICRFILNDKILAKEYFDIFLERLPDKNVDERPLIQKWMN